MFDNFRIQNVREFVEQYKENLASDIEDICSVKDCSNRISHVVSSVGVSEWSFMFLCEKHTAEEFKHEIRKYLIDSEKLDELAKNVVDRIGRDESVNINKWAEKLSNEVSHLND